ncbi:hypothetical protein ENSA7_58100 [Enhygromyxa salina]|uniref:Uncharacterized protein n=1 Tax=Enhygromyxa salina TaxID=215803 RepID=A0A2S9Y7Y0_9BACT|nr:hypothetical protein ENSA7_58100 [Enhygromyxa salina]
MITIPPLGSSSSSPRLEVVPEVTPVVDDDEDVVVLVLVLVSRGSVVVAVLVVGMGESLV